MKPSIVNHVCSLFVLGAVTTIQAQTTWNYVVSDAGGGNSLLTWNVTGDLATPPGAIRVSPQRTIALWVTAPGIYADSYVATGAAIPTFDGSYFQYDMGSVYIAIGSYYADNAPSSGNDSFGLSALSMNPFGDAGRMFHYLPGTQSALIPIDFSNFNPGSYESEQSGFNTPVSVHLTVVPEPRTLALLALSGAGTLLLFRRRTLRQ
jgi:hypothetical protein